METWKSSAGIPVVGVKQAIGIQLLQNYLGQSVTIGDVGGDNVEHSYAFLSGTSMATPHVAAGAALLWSHHPDCTNHQIRYALAATASHPKGDDFCDDHMGYGIIQLKDALDFLDDNACSTWDVSTPSKGGCSTITE